jgi:hypothetical protein
MSFEVLPSEAQLVTARTTYPRMFDVKTDWKRDIRVENVPDPVIQDPRDVILRVIAGKT